MNHPRYNLDYSQPEQAILKLEEHIEQRQLPVHALIDRTYADNAQTVLMARLRAVLGYDYYSDDDDRVYPRLREERRLTFRGALLGFSAVNLAAEDYATHNPLDVIPLNLLQLQRYIRANVRYQSSAVSNLSESAFTRLSAVDTKIKLWAEQETLGGNYAQINQVAKGLGMAIELSRLALEAEAERQ